MDTTDPKRPSGQASVITSTAPIARREMSQNTPVMRTITTSGLITVGPLPPSAEASPAPPSPNVNGQNSAVPSPCGSNNQSPVDQHPPTPYTPKQEQVHQQLPSYSPVQHQLQGYSPPTSQQQHAQFSPSNTPQMSPYTAPPSSVEQMKQETSPPPPLIAIEQPLPNNCYTRFTTRDRLVVTSSPQQRYESAAQDVVHSQYNHEDYMAPPPPLEQLPQSHLQQQQHFSAYETGDHVVEIAELQQLKPPMSPSQDHSAVGNGGTVTVHNSDSTYTTLETVQIGQGTPSYQVTFSSDPFQSTPPGSFQHYRSTSTPSSALPGLYCSPSGKIMSMTDSPMVYMKSDPTLASSAIPTTVSGVSVKASPQGMLYSFDQESTSPSTSVATLYGNNGTSYQLPGTSKDASLQFWPHAVSAGDYIGTSASSVSAANYGSGVQDNAVSYVPYTPNGSLVQGSSHSWSMDLDASELGKLIIFTYKNDIAFQM